MVARLQAAADRYPHDAALAALLAELRAGSLELTDIWATNPVRVPATVIQFYGRVADGGAVR